MKSMDELECETIGLAKRVHEILRSASEPRVAFAALCAVMETLAIESGISPTEAARDIYEFLKDNPTPPEIL